MKEAIESEKQPHLRCSVVQSEGASSVFNWWDMRQGRRKLSRRLCVENRKEAMALPKRDLKPRLELDSKGRVVIPKIIREALKLEKGAVMEAEVWGEDKILITILRR